MAKHKQERTSLTTVWEKLKKTWEKKKGTAALVFGGALFFYLVFLAMGPWLNSFDLKDWKCEAISASPHTSSGGLRGSASTASVIVETKNCGRIYIGGKAVNFSNQEAVAASFEPGSEWIFKLGWFTRNYSMRIEGNPPTVYEYHRVH